MSEIVKKSFKSLPISTMTIIAYFNCTFNLEKMNKYLSFIISEKGQCEYSSAEYGQLFKKSSKSDFRNQITFIIYVEKPITITVFRTGKLKINGCSSFKHQKDSMTELVRHLNQVKKDIDPEIYQLDDENPLNVILEVVMINVDFHLGFDIDQKKLDQVLQKKTIDFYVLSDIAINPSVNIKLESEEPQYKKYDQLIFHDSKVEHKIINKCEKAKSKDHRIHTFLVFSSSKVIQSGRFYDQMEFVYNKFYDFILNNKDMIELKIHTDKFDMNVLTGLKNFKFNEKKDPKFFVGKQK